MSIESKADEFQRKRNYEAHARWRAKHREELAAKARAYYRANCEKVKQRNRERYRERYSPKKATEEKEKEI